MQLYLDHPKHGRILSFEGWINNNPSNNCSYCGQPVEIKGFCPQHYEDFQYRRKVLDEIIKYRMEQRNERR